MLQIEIDWLFLLYVVFESIFWKNKLKGESKNEEERNNL